MSELMEHTGALAQDSCGPRASTVPLAPMSLPLKEHNQSLQHTGQSEAHLRVRAQRLRTQASLRGPVHPHSPPTPLLLVLPVGRHQDSGDMRDACRGRAEAHL